MSASVQDREIKIAAARDKWLLAIEKHPQQAEVWKAEYLRIATPDPIGKIHEISRQ